MISNYFYFEIAIKLSKQPSIKLQLKVVRNVEQGLVRIYLFNAIFVFLWFTPFYFSTYIFLIVILMKNYSFIFKFCFSLKKIDTRKFFIFTRQMAVNAFVKTRKQNENLKTIFFSFSFNRISLNNKSNLFATSTTVIFYSTDLFIS